MMQVVADRIIWNSILSCCPRNHYGHERVLKEDEYYSTGKKITGF